MKKVVRLTESDLENIVKRVIEEQGEGVSLEREYIRAIQKFLNFKKIYGKDIDRNKNKKELKVDGKSDLNMKSQTAQAIAEYQSMLGGIDIDGIWGRETWDKMPPQDEKILRKYIAEEAGPIEKFFNWLGF